MYTITRMNSGNYYCEGRVQDGTERWTERTLEDAVASMIKFAKFMNGTKIKKKDITFQQQMPVPIIPWEPFR